MSRIIAQVSDALVRRLPELVRLPNKDGMRRNKHSVFLMANFPELVGDIDGTHVKIIALREHDEQFVNRKQYHSINVQVVMDADCKLVIVNACWPGSTHDARILCESRLCNRLGHINRHLDSGNPLCHWLLTPIL